MFLSIKKDFFRMVGVDKRILFAYNDRKYVDMGKAENEKSSIPGTFREKPSSGGSGFKGWYAKCIRELIRRKEVAGYVWHTLHVIKRKAKAF